MPWALKLGLMQPFKTILLWQFSICFIFILEVLKDGFCAAVEGVAGGVVLVDVDDGYSQKVYYQLIRQSYILYIYTLTFGR